ncbi:MAG: hypothetical protein IKS75_02315 [Clostridiales bacterium]|nr:hypothetical protein [Clostridiales bacterium]
MKRTLKSILCSILAIAAVAAVFTGCGSKDVKKDTKPARDKNTTSANNNSNVDWDQVIEPREIWLFDLDDEDIFETGYYGQQVELEYPSDKIIFARYWSDDVEWKVYVLDEELTDGFEALEEMEPVLVNDGEIEIQEGQWIYVYCGCNSATCDKPVGGRYKAYYWGP